MTPESREAKVAQYTPMVWKEANRAWAAGYGRHLGTNDDCFQADMLGLLSAIDAYDLDRGVPFEAHATTKIRHAIIDACDRAALARTMRRHEHATLQSHGQPVAVTCFFVGAETLDLLAAGEGQRLADNWPEVEQAMRRLSPRHRRVVDLRFFQGKTLFEAGKELGVSAERIRQLQDEAIKRLRVLLQVP